MIAIVGQNKGINRDDFPIYELLAMAGSIEESMANPESYVKEICKRIYLEQVE